MNRKFYILLLIVFNTLNTCYAQESVNGNNSLFKGLHKADFKDLDNSQPFMLDGITIPVYSEELIRVEGENFMKVMMSADFVPEPYIDSTKAVKLFVLRKATDLEKSQMMQFQGDTPKSNAIIGKPAIPFKVTDLAGKNYSLESLKGKTIVINFWFIECKPCVMEIPDLNKLVEKYTGKDVVFLGIANNEKSKIQKFLEKQPYTYNLIAGDIKVANDYGIMAYPTHIIIDSNGVVAFSTSGLGPTTMSDIDQLLGMLTK